MSTIKICPGCHQPLPEGAPDGLCPGCLMKAGLGTDVQVGAETHDEDARGAADAPSPEAVGAHFPDLEILELLGHGGMGSVYKARQPHLNRFVALKILAADKGREPAFAERFTREAQTLARLNHPNIVTLYDFGKVDELYYLLMEHVDGVSLRRLLQTKMLKPEEALAIVPKICEALQYAHEHGVVHRDIKPENVLLNQEGRVKIADFGIAKMVGTEAMQLAITQEQQVIGTPHYMAPEQVEHPKEVDHRADIYSLGVVFYEMLTGELPLGKFQPPSRKVQVDVRLDEIVLHALEKEPERRYQHASEVKTDVETLASASPASESPPQPPVVAPKRRLLQAKAGGFFLAAVCFLIAAISFFTSDANALAAVMSFAAVAGFSISGYRYIRAALGSTQPPSASQQPAGMPATRVEQARRQVKGPAIGLLVTGILNWILIPLVVVFVRWVVPFQWKGLRLNLSGDAINAVFVASLALCSFMIYAALRMMQLESYRASVAASVAAIFVTPGNVLGLPLGIWALARLARGDVKAAFRKSHSEYWDIVPAWGAFLAIGVLGAYGVQLGGRMIYRIRIGMPTAVIERVLYSVADQHPIKGEDLDERQDIEVPAGLQQAGEDRFFVWLAEQGVDLMAFAHKQSWDLWTNAKLAAVPQAWWQQPVAADLRAALNSGDAGLEHAEPDAKAGFVSYRLGTTTAFPLTFAFRTQVGNVGLLQITGFEDNPSRVKIHYRLL